MRIRIIALLALAFVFSSPAAEAQTLSTHVDVTTGPPTWSYTLFNDEPTGSPNFLNAFSLDMQAPFTVTGTPVGWDFQTNGLTFLLWFNPDPALPYPNDIAPGASLGGFELTSTATGSVLDDFGIDSWDHDQDAPGPSRFGRTLGPGAASVVPEPGSLALLVAGGLGLVPAWWRRRRRGLQDASLH